MERPVDVREIEQELVNSLTGRRFAHVLGTAMMAAGLAVRYGVDPDQAWLAGLLHDAVREWPLAKQLEQLGEESRSLDSWEITWAELVHGPAGACWAGNHYGIRDPAILEAIRFHTVGNPQMGLLAKIIFVADKAEPNRNYPGVETVRCLANSAIDSAMIACLEQSIRYILDQGILLHPLTVATRNQLLLTQKNIQKEE